MTASELADVLEDDYWDSRANKVMLEGAKMLRQQQAEIEALKKEAALQRLSDFTQEAESFDRTASHMAGEYVSYPLKELTDEEILILWTSSNFVGYTENGHIDEIFFNKFARAILLKAQEK